MVVRTLVSAAKLSLSCDRLVAGHATTLWVGRQSHKANSACHPSRVDKYVVTLEIRCKGSEYGRWRGKGVAYRPRRVL